MRLKQDWSAVPAGEIYPVQFRKGDVLSGELADRARALDLLEEIEKPKPPRRKALRGAPENK